MIQEIEEKSLLMEYAKKKKIDELSSEDILKLMSAPYLAKEIADAFGITEKEFNTIKKKLGISNTLLENMIRDIEVILNYIDSKERYVSNAIRNKIVDTLIPAFTNKIPKKEFYIKKLSEINFNREKVRNDTIDKQIDQEHRLKELADILFNIDEIVERLLKQEKEYLLNYNEQKIYNQMKEEKKNGKTFNKEDLTYDLLFELSVIENTPDSLIGNIFDMKKTQIKYLRQKMGLVNTYQKRIEAYPESLIYYMEEKNQRTPNISNYELEKLVTGITSSIYKEEPENKEKQEVPTNIKDEEKEVISININGEEIKYHVTFSEEKFIAKTKSKTKRKSNGSHRNYKKENETKQIHGKIGEQLAFEMEKRRLRKIGLEALIEDVKLVAQISEDITFDGLGYDLISFNEQKERICIEVKTSFGTKDKPFFISEKEKELMLGLKEEFDCKSCLIYYVLIDDTDVTIQTIYTNDFAELKLTPVLYKVESY